MIKFQSKNPNDILEQLQKEICCLDEQIQQIVVGGLGWALSGNVVLPTSFIGSTNLADFVVKTNNAERMRVVASGLVGINTSTPTAPLDINGQIRVRGGAPGAGKVLTSDANGLATWEVINIPPGGVTGAESGLHLQGTVARLGGPLLETAAIIGDAPTKKVIFQGVVDLVNGDYTDAYVIYDVIGECPAIGIHAENDGISIDAGNNGINITGGVFGVNVVGDTTGIVSVGNTQNGGDFSGLHGGLNITYGRQTDAGQGTDYGIKVNANGIGNKGTPIVVDIPTYSGTLQNMINMSQSTNSVVGNGYGQSVRFSYGVPGGGSVPLTINELRSVWSNVGTLTQAFQLWAPIPGNLTSIQQTFTMYNSGQLQLNKYTGATPFVGGTRMLTIDTASGAVFTQAIPAFSGLTAANSGVRVDGTTVKLGGQLLESASIPILDATLGISISGINANTNSPTFSVSTTGGGGIAIRGTSTSGAGYGVSGMTTGTFGSAGVYGQSTLTNTVGVLGENTSTGYGVRGIVTGSGVGVHGYSSGNGTGIRGDSYTPAIAPGSGVGVYGTTGTGTALFGTANSSGIAIQGISGFGLGMYLNSSLKVFRINFDNPTAPASGIHIIGSFEKTTSNQAVAGVGFGSAIEHQLASSTGLARQAGTDVFRWIDPLDATRTSAYDLTLVNSSLSSTVFTALGNGNIGIGQTVPTAKLEIVAATSGEIISYGAGAGNTTDFGLIIKPLASTNLGNPLQVLYNDTIGTGVTNLFNLSRSSSSAMSAGIGVSLRFEMNSNPATIETLIPTGEIRSTWTFVNGQNSNMQFFTSNAGTLTLAATIASNGNLTTIGAVLAPFLQAGSTIYDVGNISNSISGSGQFFINSNSGASLNLNAPATRVGGSLTAPTAKLHIAANTSGIANRTPLKLTAGTNVSVPEDGAFEYDGASLYFTTGSTRNTFVFNSTPGATIYTGDGAIGSTRTIDVAGFGVTWNDTGLFRIVNGNATIGGTYDFNAGCDLSSFNATNSANFSTDPVSGITLEYVTLPSTITSSVTVDNLGVKLTGIQEFADNAAAVTGGLTNGYVYRTGDNLKIVHP